MRWRKGPRPWPIHLFAAILVIEGLHGLYRGFVAADITASHLQKSIPSIEWTWDLMVVVNSALFTIVLIPVVAIWAYASRVARVLVVVMAAPTVLHLISMVNTALWFGQVFDPFPIAFAVLRLMALVLLFTPASHRWFAERGGVDPAVFE